MTDNIQNGEGVELLPCPFCGGDAERFTIEEEGDNFGGDVIQCMGMCGASSHVEFGRKENLVSLWNTRHSLAREPATADVEREDYNGHSPNEYIPDLPDGAKLFAVSLETGQFHYINHAGTWQGMPSPLSPSSEPAIAEGERAYRAGFSDGVEHGFAGGRGEGSECDEDAGWAKYAALAQSSTPPASKGVEERTDADLLRLIAKDHARLAPNAHHSAETLRQIADRLDAPTPSNDTLQGRGEVEADLRHAVRRIIARCEAIEDENSDQLAKEQTEASSGFLRGERHLAKSIRRELHDLTRAALQKDTRHAG